MTSCESTEEVLELDSDNSDVYTDSSVESNIDESSDSLRSMSYDTSSRLLLNSLGWDQFRYIKIQPDLSKRLWGINPTNSVFIPQSLVLRSFVLG